jgi:hypothetical protein
VHRAPLSPAQVNNRNAFPRDNRARQQNPREQRKCWYCLENWTVGHRCQPMQQALHTIVMQGNEDDSSDDNERQEAVQRLQEPLLQAPPQENVPLLLLTI